MLVLLPATALTAPPDTVKLEDCTYNGVRYDSPALGTCTLQQMRFNAGGKSTMGFCAEKGKGMAHALGVDDVWDSDYTWTMNAWVQAVIWRYKAGSLSDTVTASAEELMCVYNNFNREHKIRGCLKRLKALGWSPDISIASA